MKLLCKKIKSHTCLEIFQSTNDTNRRGHSVLFHSLRGHPVFFGSSCSRAFRKPENADEDGKLTKNGIPSQLFH